MNTYTSNSTNNTTSTQNHSRTLVDVRFDPDKCDRFPVFCQYGNQYRPQPAYITLDLRTGVVDAEYNAEFGSQPIDHWLGLVQTFPILPHLYRDSIAEIIDYMKEDMQFILDGSEIVWDGSDHIPQFSDLANQLLEKYDSFDLYDMLPTCDVRMSIPEFLASYEPDWALSNDEILDDILAYDGEDGYYFYTDDRDLLLQDLVDYKQDMLDE